MRWDGRSIAKVDPHAADNVRRMFDLYAYEPLPFDRLIERLTAEGRLYRLPAMPFARGSVHNILRDRAYIGEVEFRGNWYPGKQEPIVDGGTWNRAQAIVRGCVYHSHEMTSAAEFRTCGHCGHPITSERKTRQTKNGPREYVYYRCSRYTAAGHPRTRVPKAELDFQILELFGRMKIQDPDVVEWFRAVLRSQSKDAQEEPLSQQAELQRQHTLLPSRAVLSTCGSPRRSIRKRWPGSRPSYAIDWPRSRCNWKS